MVYNLQTGDILRTVKPDALGLLWSVCLTEDDLHAVCHTSSHQVLVINIYSGELVTVIKKAVYLTEEIVNTKVSGGKIYVWTSRNWYLYSLQGEPLRSSSYTDDTKLPIIGVYPLPDTEDVLVLRKETNIVPSPEHFVKLSLNQEETELVPDLGLHSALVFTRGMRRLYTCVKMYRTDVVCLKYWDGAWEIDDMYINEDGIVLSLTLSPDETWLVASLSSMLSKLTDDDEYIVMPSPDKFTLWNLKTEKSYNLNLPQSVKNIPAKLSVNNDVCFTNGNHFLITKVRNIIYVFNVKRQELVNILDAHFERVINIITVINEKTNKFISSSIDRKIKVWNCRNISERVKPVDSLRQKIIGLSVAARAPYAVATTRKSVGLWNYESGELLWSRQTELVRPYSKAAISEDGDVVVAVDPPFVRLLGREVTDETSFKEEHARQVLVHEASFYLITHIEQAMKTSITQGEISSGIVAIDVQER